MDIPAYLAASPLAHVAFGNPLYRWAAALAIVLVAVLFASLLLRIGTRVLRRVASRTRTRVDDALVDALGATRLWLIALSALHPASRVLALPAGIVRAVSAVAIIALFLQIGLWGARLLEGWFTHTRERALANNPAALSSFGAISFIARVTMWSVIALLVLDNLGVNISTLVTGLGIGGIAIGLALQNILGDLFASLSIVLDKPFTVGDVITIDDLSGTVEHIGVKTTRLRARDGELLVFANGDLTKSRLRNFRHMRERRILFGFGVRCETTPDQLAAIPGIVRDVVEAQPKTRFERAHFKAFGASSLDFEVVYWMLTADYLAYMDVQQAVNLALLRRFAEVGIQFAFPSRTLYFADALRVEGGPPTAR